MVLKFSLIWGLYILRFYRAWRARLLITTTGKRIWLTVYLGCLAVSLSGEAAEHELDRTLFADTPVTLYLKASIILFAWYLYYHILLDASPGTIARSSRLIDYTAGTSAVLIWIVALFHWLTTLPYFEARVAVVVLRDTGLGVMICTNLRLNLQLARTESITARKLNFFIATAFICSYGINAIANVGTVFALVFNDPGIVKRSLTFDTTVLSGLLIVGFLIPHRYLLPFLLWINNLRLYRRIKRLEIAVIPHILSRQSVMNRFAALLSLEEEIYAAFITILDYYPALETSNAVLYEAVHSIVNSTDEYDVLVARLGEVKPG